MVKIILEKNDIEKLIKNKYPNAEIVSGINKDLEIVIRIEDIPELLIHIPNIPPPSPPKNLVIKDGSIDAEASGLTLKNREKTTPGGAMGRTRNRLPTF